MWNQEKKEEKETISQQTLQEFAKWIEQHSFSKLSKKEWENFFRPEYQEFREEAWTIAANPRAIIPSKFSDKTGKEVISAIREYLESKEESKIMWGFEPQPRRNDKCSFCKSNYAEKLICSDCLEKVGKIETLNISFRQKLTNWIQLLTNRHA